MKYCRFVFEGDPHYGRVETRGGEFWIVDLAEAPEEDFAYRVAHARPMVAKALVKDFGEF